MNYGIFINMSYSYDLVHYYSPRETAKNATKTTPFISELSESDGHNSVSEVAYNTPSHNNQSILSKSLKSSGR